MVLELEGYEVETAADGVDALSKIESGQPDLLLLDLGTPEIDGIELLNRLTLLPVVPPSLVVSGVERRAEARRAGAVGFISKPFDLDRLLQNVASALEASPRNPQRLADSA